MRIFRCASKEQLAFDAAMAGAERIRLALQKRGEATIIVATGLSQAAMLDFLVREKLDWGSVTAFHLDEYVGIRATHPASFRKYLQARFVSKVPLKAFHAIAGEKDPISECKRLNKLIRDRDVDVAFVGIGENGHLAFNDPPADFETSTPFRVVALDDSCRRQQVGEGWFRTLNEVPKGAISMSVRQILAADSIICSVPDERKAKAVKATLEGDVTPEVPASILQDHPQTLLFLDPESSALLAPSRNPLIVETARLEDCPPIRAGSRHFHLFVAGDFAKVSEKTHAAFARRLLEAGAATLTAWGKGSSAVEVAFDNESVARGVKQDADQTAENVIATSSFKVDELDKSLFHFLDVCSPAADYEETCTSWVAVLVGKPPHKERLSNALADPGAFIDTYTQSDDDAAADDES